MPSMQPNFNWRIVKPKGMPRMRLARLGQAWMQYPVILPEIMHQSDQQWRTVIETLLMVSDMAGYVQDESMDQALRSVFSPAEALIDCGILPIVTSTRHVGFGRLVFNPDPVPKAWVVQKVRGHFSISGQMAGPAMIGKIIQATFCTVERWW